MSRIIIDVHDIPPLLCGVFYAVLCVFSLVTGLIYAGGRRALNPLELSDRTAARLDTPAGRDRFARKMGWVTFVVGIAQGITAFSLFKASAPVYYWVAMGFTLFSVLSASLKLKGKISAFPLIKLVFYLAILVVLLLPGTRALFFNRMILLIR